MLLSRRLGLFVLGLTLATTGCGSANNAGSGGSAAGGASGSGGVDGGTGGSGGIDGGAGSGGSSTGGTGGSGGVGGSSGGACSPGAQRCTASNGVEICNASGTAWLYLQTCAISCSAGLCTGACTPDAKRCNGGNVEQCDSAGSTWNVVDTCNTYCDATTAQCALPGLDVTSNTDLDGVVVVKGPVVVHSGATLHSPSGSLTIIADSITVESGASIVVAPTGSMPDGRGQDGRYDVALNLSYGGGGGGHASVGGYGGFAVPGGKAYGLDMDFVVFPGARGGNGASMMKTGNGAAGGMGGGVLRLIAPVVNVAGQITANGANGGSTAAHRTGGGGGGSGGGVLLAADDLTFSGAISVVGGAAGIASGGSSDSGGAGADGRVKLLYGAKHNLIGSVTGKETEGLLPPLTITSDTHPDSTLVYNDDFAKFELAWDKPFPGVLGYYVQTDTANATVPTPAGGTFLSGEDYTVDRSALVQGDNFFHIVPVDATSTVGTVQGWFKLQLNTKAPTITSSSHPDQTAWSTNNTVFYSWTLPVADKNLVGIHYVSDHFANTVPTKSDTFVGVSQKQKILSNLADGVWFFHVVSEDTHGYLTRVAAHYQVRIGADPGAGTILGQVVDSQSQPVNGASITVNRGLFATASNSTGNYNMQNVIAGTWEVTASKVPYAPVVKNVTVTDQNSTTVNFTLQ